MTQLAAMTPNASLPLLDTGALDEIRALDPDQGESLVGEIVAAYLGSSPALIEQLTEGTRTGDARAVQIAAHTLKSSSANVGAVRLGDLCRSAEHAARDGDLESIARAPDLIVECYSQTCKALTDLTGSGVPTD